MFPNDFILNFRALSSRFASTQGKLLQICVTQVYLAHLGFGAAPQFLWGGAKNAIFDNIFHEILSWWLTVPQWEGISKTEKSRVHR